MVGPDVADPRRVCGRCFLAEQAQFHPPGTARVSGGLLLGPPAWFWSWMASVSFRSSSILASRAFNHDLSAFRRFMIFWLRVPGVEVPVIFRLNMLVVKLLMRNL
ncbi:unnamed protein product [Prunus armeniaca]|uniref:Uncharacterized protein n=1 Tax=Prunus armeniaca TaxID=36596 RepID=A0A6J5UGR0_PRUAR|nr:unnamed protein product [Prunus armeniaca]CAB4303844.1 unnamed protein product [Prunus armeniaca]